MLGRKRARGDSIPDYGSSRPEAPRKLRRLADPSAQSDGLGDSFDDDIREISALRSATRSTRTPAPTPTHRPPGRVGTRAPLHQPTPAQGRGRSLRAAHAPANAGARGGGMAKGANAGAGILRRQVGELQESLAAETEQREEAEAAVSELEAALAESEGELGSIKSQADQLNQDLVNALSAAEQERVKNQMLQARHDALHQRSEELMKRNAELEVQLNENKEMVQEGILMRKRLHNSILELKGNIRVFVRVRGPTSVPTPQFSFPDKQDERVIEILGPNAATSMGTDMTKSYHFEYDRVFGQASTQGEIFEEISQLVQSALDGYKVCVFAYGQTGSGKTYTMEGPHADELAEEEPQEAHKETRGMIPRAVEALFKAAEGMKAQGWSYSLECQMVEIYNEELRDLLIPSSRYERKQGGANPLKHEIKHDAKGNTTVTNVTVENVSNPATVYRLLKAAARHRQTGSNNVNDHSSRSHSVFTLRLKGLNTDTQQCTQGVLNLIDLAGSERLQNSGVVGDRLKETQAINKSLSCLGDVIAALGSNQKKHVPFRNSVLTYLLQHCLGGDCKTLMFVNISPHAETINESICSLRFAAKVNACEIGRASRKITSAATALLQEASRSGSGP